MRKTCSESSSELRGGAGFRLAVGELAGRLHVHGSWEGTPVIWDLLRRMILLGGGVGSLPLLGEEEWEGRLFLTEAARPGTMMVGGDACDGVGGGAACHDEAWKLLAIWT